MKTPAHIAQQIEDIWLAEWQEKLGVDATLSSASQGKLHALRMELETGPQERGHGATEGSQPPSGIRVKMLDWRQKRSRRSGATYVAKSPFGSYLIHHRKSGAVYVSQTHAGGWTDERFDTLEEAKAACQSDFQCRITECLEVEPHTPYATGWRDISTAPTNGTPIIAWRADQGWFECRWERMGDLVPDGEECGDPDHEGWYHGEWGLLESDLRPTLWTLPPPPGEEGAGLPDAGGGKQSQLLDALLLIESALKGHHQAAQDMGTVIFPDAPGVEVDMSDGYADSALADKTTRGLQAFDELRRSVMDGGSNA